MKIKLLILFTICSIYSCKDTMHVAGTKYENSKALNEAIKKLEPGDEIVLADGTYTDMQIRFYGEGTEEKPITLRAENPGKVFIEGASNLRLGGKHLIVDGLYFRNGASPKKSVIQFYTNKKTVASHCRVTNCVIEDYNKAQKSDSDLWVLFKGRHNELDHCYLAGKSNKGPTVRIDISGNESINNYHKIHHNHFGPRPPKGGPSAETIQIGDSYTSISPSYTMIYENFFDRCNGEVEVISSKTNFNEFRNNVFYKSEGSLVTRHGNYCTVDGNYFIGDDDSANYGGIRLIGTGHWVTNNYFYKLKGEIFRAPLAVMNGIKKSPLNRYIQVTDIVVAHNTWVDCISPLQFGVGSNIDQKDVLPPSEIRSETPIRSIVADNVIYNSTGDEMPIYRHDKIDGIEFVSNVINNQGVKFEGVEGLEELDFTMNEIEKNIMVPSSEIANVEVYQGFDFEKINKDIFGNDRDVDNNFVGAINGSSVTAPDIMNLDKYGPSWFDSSPKKVEPSTLAAGSTTELIEAIEKANDGDIISLSSSKYEINSSLKVNKSLTIQSQNDEKATLSFIGSSGTPLFEMNPKGQLTLSSINLEGNGKNYTFASLRKNMSSLYNLTVNDCKISNFDFVLKAYKSSFAEHITFSNSSIYKCNNGIELSSEDDDRGEYNAENVTITGCTFEGIKQNVIDYYRGGYDESTVGGTLLIERSTFTNSGNKEANGVLINTYGIINVNLNNNTFKNNNVKLIARLWGAKNNFESENKTQNSGKIITEQNLPLKLMY